MTNRRKGIIPSTVFIALIIVVAGVIGIVAIDSQPSNGPTSHPVRVVSVIGPLAPPSQGRQSVSVTLENNGTSPLTSLNVTLAMIPPLSVPGGIRVPYNLTFNVNAANPLQAGQTTSGTLRVLEGTFQQNSDYELTINGTLSSGAQFSYTVSGQMEPPS
jgi:hypothetical protein